jgi:hypothetical protein
MAQRHRLLLPCALALVLTALAWLAAPAAPAQDAAERAALATERYYSSYGEPARGERAALATERYLSSYGTPQPPATASAVTADPGPTWTAAIIVGALLIVTAAGVGVLAGRASVRPRRATA